MIQFLHSSWAYLVLLMFIVTLVTYALNLSQNKVFDYRKDFRLASFTLIVLYFQIVLGLLAWFTSDYFEGIKQGHMKEYMKHAHDRLLVVEHPTMMLIALLLTHYGFNRMKKAENSRKKFMAVILLYGIAFLLILSRIPWNVWL